MRAGFQSGSSGDHFTLTRRNLDRDDLGRSRPKNKAAGADLLDIAAVESDVGTVGRPTRCAGGLGASVRDPTQTRAIRADDVDVAVLRRYEGAGSGSGSILAGTRPITVR